MKKFPHHSRDQLGLSLTEILISVLILSVGLLGIAGLQGSSLISTRSANLRTQAIILSQDIIESMHANRTQALSGKSNNYSIAFGAKATDPSIDCSLNTCAPNELAIYDRFHWWEKVNDTKKIGNKSKFPLGTGEIDISALGIVTVSIKWRDNVLQNVSKPANAVDKYTTFTFTSML